MNPIWIFLSSFGFIASQTGAALLFKMGTTRTGLGWWIYFAAGNAVGFGCPVTLSIALRGTNPNLIYALCYGGGFLLLQLAAWYFFREPLSPWQWSGVVLVAGGVILLQIR